MRITANQFKEAVDLLETFRTDYQFDKNHHHYLGFLNVSTEFLTEEKQPTWNLICNRPQIFMPIIHELGLEIEEDRLDPDETVFLLADN